MTNQLNLKLERFPNNPQRGFRNLKIEKELFIENLDFSKLKVGDKFRLMHFGNFELLENNKIKFISKEYDKNLKLRGNFHFVCEYEEIKILFNENDEKETAYLEKDNLLSEGDICQFERIGFFKYTKFCVCSQIKKFRFCLR